MAKCLGRGVGVEPDAVAAFRIFKELSEDGNAESYLWLARMNLLGKGMAEDRDAAGRYYHLASDMGIIEGLGELGHLYFSGNVVGIDYDIGAELLKRFA